MKSQKNAKYFLEILTIFIHIPKNGETEAVYIYYAFFGCMKKYLKHGRPKVEKSAVIYIYVEFGVVVIKLRSTRGSNCSSRAELARLESCNYCLKC